MNIGRVGIWSMAMEAQPLVSPVQTTRDYLEAMDAARYFGAGPAAPLHRVLAKEHLDAGADHVALREWRELSALLD